MIYRRQSITTVIVLDPVLTKLTSQHRLAQSLKSAATRSGGHKANYHLKIL